LKICYHPLKKDHSSTELSFDEQFIAEPGNVVDTLANYFQPVFNASCLAIFHSASVTTDTPPTAHFLR
jgi:hypothetical protein